MEDIRLIADHQHRLATALDRSRQVIEELRDLAKSGGELPGEEELAQLERMSLQVADVAHAMQREVAEAIVRVREARQQASSEAADTEDFATNVAHTLRWLRERAGWTQARIADAMQMVGFDWKRITVAEVEGGGRKVSYEELLALAGLFGVRLIEILCPETEYVSFPKGRRVSSRDVWYLIMGINPVEESEPAATPHFVDGGPMWTPAAAVTGSDVGDGDWRPARDLWKQFQVEGHDLQRSDLPLPSAPSYGLWILPPTDAPEAWRTSRERDGRFETLGRFVHRVEVLWPDFLKQESPGEILYSIDRSPPVPAFEAARKLDIGFLDVSVIAHRLWGHDLTDECVNRLGGRQLKRGLRAEWVRSRILRSCIEDMRPIADEVAPMLSRMDAEWVYRNLSETIDRMDSEGDLERPSEEEILDAVARFVRSHRLRGDQITRANIDDLIASLQRDIQFTLREPYRAETQEYARRRPSERWHGSGGL